MRTFQFAMVQDTLLVENIAGQATFPQLRRVCFFPLCAHDRGRFVIVLIVVCLHPATSKNVVSQGQVRVTLQHSATQCKGADNSEHLDQLELNARFSKSWSRR